MSINISNLKKKIKAKRRKKKSEMKKTPHDQGEHSERSELVLVPGNSSKDEERKQLMEDETPESEKKESSETSQSASELKELFEKLRKINSDMLGSELELESGNSWATGYGINKTLTKLLGDTVYLVNPDSGSVESPVSSNEDEALMGTINYVKMIRGFYDSDGQFRDNGLIRGEEGRLDKPIIMIWNTDSIKVENSKSSEKRGGNHWQTCVILPKNYVTPFGESINNLKEIVFFIDSKYENILAPALLEHLLKYGLEYAFSLKGIRYTHCIPPSMPEVDLPPCVNIKQQDGGSDCGWWAVYNALMFVFTGKKDFLDQFKKRSRGPAYTLRKLFTNLTDESDDKPSDEKKLKEEVNKEEQKAILQAIKASLEDMNFKAPKDKTIIKKVKKKVKLRKKNKTGLDEISISIQNKDGKNQENLQPQFSSLEKQLIQAVRRSKIDLEEVSEILKNLLDAEQYITIRDDAGKLPINVIQERLGVWFTRRVESVKSVKNHNEMIDAKKIKRLYEIVNMIEKSEIFERFIGYFDKNNLNRNDLTFLLTLVLKLNKNPLRLDLLNFLLDKGADVNGLGMSGHRPAYVAVHCGNLDALRIFKERGANLQLTDIADRTLIFAAVRNERNDLLPALVKEFGCDINSFDYHGNTLLHDTVMQGTLEGTVSQERRVGGATVKTLIELRADPTVRNILGETPLDNASSGTHGFDVILDSHFRSEYSKRIIRYNRERIAEVLRIAIQENVRISRIFSAIEKQEGLTISLAYLEVQDKDLALLKSVLTKRSNIYSLDLSGNPITSAGMTEIVDCLESETWICYLTLKDTGLTSQEKKDLLERLSPNRRFERFLTKYNATEELDRLRNLINFGVTVEQINKVNSEGWFIVHLAACHGHFNTISFLIEKGGNVGRPMEEDGRTALHLAAENGRKQAVRTLLNAGAQQVDPVDAMGHTPLSLTVRKGHILVVETLLSHGANPNHVIKLQACKEGIQSYKEDIKSHNEQSILEVAIQNQKPKITKQLLKSGAKFTPEVFSFLKTPLTGKKHEMQLILKARITQEENLFKAVSTNNQDRVEELLNEGVDIDCTDNNGFTCLQHALQKKYLPLAAWFIFKGANYDIPELASNKTIVKPGQLSDKEKQELNYHISQFRFRHPKSAIYFLQSKTEYVSQPSKGDFGIFPMYKDLFGYSEQDAFDQYTRPILQVIEHCLELRIVYDPRKGDTKRADICGEASAKGKYLSDSRTIQIAGKDGSYEEVRGTVIHECCHMACDLVWKNQRNPYSPKTEEETRFIAICSEIQNENENVETRENLDPIIQGAFSPRYSPEKYIHELIVRVPEIIATHGIQRTQELCKLSPGFKRLFDFYKENVLPSFQKYVADNQSKKWAYLQREKSWSALTLSRKIKVVDTKEAIEATKIQSLWRGSLVRRIYPQIKFIHNYVEGLKSFFNGLGAVNTSKCLEDELHPAISEILDGCSSNNLLFSFKKSKELFEKFRENKEKTLDKISTPKIKLRKGD